METAQDYADEVRLAADDALPRIIVPEPATLFAHRARRFEELAEGHALSDWLRFLGRVSDAQHAALQELGEPPMPAAAAMERARRYGMPPLAAEQWQPQAIWQDTLHKIAANLDIGATLTIRRTLARLRGTEPAQLDALAKNVLRTQLRSADADLLPFIAAALQVLWAAMAARLGSAGIQPLDVASICPCCGSLPVASIVRDAGEIRSLRYLHCSLCSTEWNMVRVQCAACEAGGAHIAYRQIEGTKAPATVAMRAETCDDCKSYLKILYLEKAPRGDPVADDLATLALDMLVDEAGYSRAGPNLLFISGET